MTAHPTTPRHCIPTRGEVDVSARWHDCGFGAPPLVAAMTEARGWLLDCGFDEDTLDETADWQVAALTARNYEGGWAAFALAIDEQPVTAPTTKGSTR
ncbi:hypothetical protein HQO27_01660 [Rhodococcus fascians]|nr:hypothetical protein [Rhodococcus fascians]MBY4240603.1 hypothetical protein [Rhodococcus fascians]MBY4253444.1 hypothetical protein [Rhodococcus fascians]MBY4269081.1 hypothetical protein [Rhodococcus fascians]MBY4274512.1 hypothetical protein [Rhodococcus fascians]